MVFDDNYPIYIQIMNIIKERIIDNTYDNGSKLPSVRDMSKELKVNPNTIQRAYKELEMEELIFTKRGMGTFITEDEEVTRTMKKEMVKETIEVFLREIEKFGFSEDEIKDMIDQVRSDKNE